MRGQTNGPIAAVIAVIVVGLTLAVVAIINSQVLSNTASSYGCTAGTWNATVKDQAGAAVPGNACTTRGDTVHKCCTAYNATVACCQTTGTPSSATNTLLQSATSLTLGDILPLVLVSALIIGVLVSAFRI